MPNNKKMQPEANDPTEQSSPAQGKPVSPADQQTRHGSDSETRAARRPAESPAGRRPLFRN
jgi:hypothetical protein